MIYPLGKLTQWTDLAVIRMSMLQCKIFLLKINIKVEKMEQNILYML